MTGLSPEDREVLRERLCARRSALMGEIAAGLGSGGLRVDALSRSTDDVEAEVTAASAERDSIELLEVESALARLEDGSYGLCVDCGASLPWLRIRAVPEARRCISCESARERRTAGHASL